MTDSTAASVAELAMTALLEKLKAELQEWRDQRYLLNARENLRRDVEPDEWWASDEAAKEIVFDLCRTLDVEPTRLMNRHRRDDGTRCSWSGQAFVPAYQKRSDYCPADCVESGYVEE